MTTHTFTTEELAARDAAISAKALQMTGESVEQALINLAAQHGTLTCCRSNSTECCGDPNVSIDHEVALEVVNAAILALQPPPSRWQEVPEGSVLVPVALLKALAPEKPSEEAKDGPCCHELLQFRDGRARWIGIGCGCGNSGDTENAAHWASEMNRWLEFNEVCSRFDFDITMIGATP